MSFNVLLLSAQPGMAGSFRGGGSRRGAGLSELTDLDTTIAIQVGTALRKRHCRVEVVGVDERIPTELGGFGAAVPDGRGANGRLAELDELIAHAVEPGPPFGHGVGRRRVAGGAAVGENECRHPRLLSVGG